MQESQLDSRSSGSNQLSAGFDLFMAFLGRSLGDVFLPNTTIEQLRWFALSQRSKPPTPISRSVETWRLLWAHRVERCISGGIFNPSSHIWRPRQGSGRAESRPGSRTHGYVPPKTWRHQNGAGLGQVDQSMPPKGAAGAGCSWTHVFK